MIRQIKAEFLKLLTVRSTYILVSLALALTFLFAYFGTSAITYSDAICSDTGELMYSMNYEDPRLAESTPEEVCAGEIEYVEKTERTLGKEKIVMSLQEGVPVTITFITIILILLVAHEYRHNTISYSLTTSSSRSKVLASKLIVGGIFTVLVTLLAIAVNVATVYLAVSVKDLMLPAQDYDWLYIISRHILYGLGYSTFFIGIATLVKNLTAGIATVFLLPTIDGIAGMLLSTRDIEPTRVMPFMALDRFGNVAGDVVYSSADVGERFFTFTDKLPPTAWGALGIFAAYLVGLWVITWFLYLRRDAN